MNTNIVIDKNTPKNKRVLVQSAVTFAVLFGLFIAINCFSTYDSFYSIYIPDLKEDSDRIKSYARSILQEYSSLSWLMDYCQENSQSLDVSRKTHNPEKYDSLPAELLIHNKNITPEQAKALTPDQQRLFAEFCYREILSKLDRLKNHLQMHSLYIVKPLPDKNAFVFYYKDSNEETHVLGDIFPFDITKHPLIQGMYSSGKAPADFEHITIKDYYATHRTEQLVYDYEPLTDNGTVYAHIAVSLLETDILKAIHHELAEIEGINVLCFILLGILLLLAIYMQVLKPLSGVQQHVREYTDNKDSTFMVNALRKIQSRNEIGRLVDDLSSLAVELDHYTAETAKLSAEKAKLDSELSLAASIQQDSLPNDFSNITGFQLFTFLKPAKEVGGDLYDFFMIDDDHIVLAVGDVSGKGISAALFMMRVKTMLKDAALLTHASPLEIVTNINTRLCEENDAMMFVTLWLGIMTISTGEIVYVNAGHEYPFIKDSSGKFSVDQSAHSKPLAINPKAKFSEGRLTLGHGDTLLVYTDGVPEANNEASELFGMDRFADILNENADGTPQEIAYALLERLKEFTGDAPQFDDITLLYVKYTS